MSGIEKRLDRISRSLFAIENGGYSEFTLHECADYISWIAKYRKVPESIWHPICDKIIYLLKNGY